MNHNYPGLLLESVKDYCILMLDTEGAIRYTNKAVKHVQGYSPEEVNGRPFSIFYPEAERLADKLAADLSAAMRQGHFEMERWLVRKDGIGFWSNILITPVYTQEAEWVGYSCILRDLTDKKLAEQALKESEERTRLMVSGVKDYAIFMMDPNGFIISWNEGAQRIKGYVAAEVVGRHFSLFYTQEDCDDGKPAREIRIATATGKYEEEGWRVKKDGSLFWANVVITAIYNNQQELIGFAKVTRDLTERRKAEETLRESEKRYRELATRLHETNKELEFTNSELEQFTGIVSHDLQEPLRTVTSFLDLIQLRIGEEAKPEIKTYITKALNGSHRMRDLIISLLHFAQVSKTEVQQEWLSVKDLIADTLQNLKSSIDASGAEITEELDLETVLGDRVQLVQLIQNIIGNALKFRGNDQPRIHIKAVREGDYGAFSISDNGIGIAPQYQDQVFEVFKRLHAKSEFPGTGIGLAICRKIVDRHSGRIWVESNAGAGTTFHFTLLQQVPETAPETKNTLMTGSSWKV